MVLKRLLEMNGLLVVAVASAIMIQVDRDGRFVVSSLLKPEGC